jgi:hypothetical protein
MSETPISNEENQFKVEQIDIILNTLLDKQNLKFCSNGILEGDGSHAANNLQPHYALSKLCYKPYGRK